MPRDASARAPMVATTALLFAVGLWTLLILTLPELRFNLRLPGAAPALDGASVVISASAAGLAFLHVSTTRARWWLMIGLAFSVLAAQRLVFGIVVGPGATGTTGGVYIWTTGRLVAGGLLLIAALMWRRNAPPVTVRTALGVGSLTVVVVALTDLVIWSSAETLPPLTTSPAAVRGDEVIGAVDAIDPRFVAVQVVGSALFAATAALFIRPPAGRAEGPTWLAPPLVLAAFSHVHYLLAPTVYGDRVSTGDLLQMAFAMLLLAGLAREVRRSYVLEHGRAAELEAAYAAERGRVGDLERADRARARLFAILTHELLNPVAAIRAAAVALERRWESIPDATKRDMLGRIGGQSEQLSHVAADASATLQEQAPALSVDPRDVPVGRLLDDAVAGAVFLEDRLTVRVDDEVAAASVRADPPRVQQVFANLLTNAARHGSPGREVELAAAADGDRVRFSVKNPGPGIPEDQRDRLFEAFTRLRDDRPGSGLGLFICKRIVEAHGGAIAVDGDAEHTVFTFTLPRARETG